MEEKKQESKFLDRINELNNTINKGNMLSPPMSSDEAIYFLRIYLLGEDWYGTSPILNDYIYTEIAHDILIKYSRKYRKDYKERIKKKIPIFGIDLVNLEMGFCYDVPIISIDQAIDILRSYLLGKDWYTVDPLSKEQTNTEIVYDILQKYSKRYKREQRRVYKAWKKRK